MVLASAELNIEQIFDLWTYEPDLLSILDIRDPRNYSKAHIPGSVWLSSEELIEFLESAPRETYHVIVTDEDHEVEWCEKLQIFPHGQVLKGGISAWNEKKWPLSNTPKNEQPVRSSDLLLFHQLFEHETSTFTYLLADDETKEAIIIDPVLETADRDLTLIRELGLKLKYIIETHVHADHVTGAEKLRKATGAQVAISKLAGVSCADVQLVDEQILNFGRFTIKALATPGHTEGCMSFLCDKMVFTGDTLLIRSTGRTDYQLGSAEKLYKSITDKLFRLPPQTRVYPAHDYKGFTVSSIGAERLNNPRIGGNKSVDEFAKIMSEVRIAPPKKMQKAVGANMKCGQLFDSMIFHPQVVNGVPEVSVHDVSKHLGEVALIDVRRPEEYNDVLGHIKGTTLVTLGPDLQEWLKNSDKEQEVVFVCRSGGRSGAATQQALEAGFKSPRNMAGGMIRWNEMNLSIEKK